MQEGEERPIGLLLCSEGNTEHIELLMLDEKKNQGSTISYGTAEQGVVCRQAAQGAGNSKNEFTW